MASNAVPKLSEEQYLAIEREAEFRSEFFDGRLFSMAGASFQHVRIAHNLQVELAARVSRTDCEICGPDLRVKLSGGNYVYPDLTVVCGPPKFADSRQDVLLNPGAVFEILSPSTEGNNIVDNS